MILLILQQLVEYQSAEEDGSKERRKDTDNQSGSESLDRARTEIEQDDTGKDGGKVGVHNGTHGIAVSIIEGMVYILALGQLLSRSFIYQHIGVDRHTQRKHDTRYTW